MGLGASCPKVMGAQIATNATTDKMTREPNCFILLLKPLRRNFFCYSKEEMQTVKTSAFRSAWTDPQLVIRGLASRLQPMPSPLRSRRHSFASPPQQARSDRTADC